ncbi:hypothetical protein KJ652_01835, partial [Patescibacteria group bacterium]|nr:hypothetical protein [Patescibacteria group bacterium]
ATLSADTTDRSAQFWASLQSDILGDTIAIHGTNDKVISLPIGATALDGAFYLLGKKALSVSTINVDGKETQFAIPIENAASLDFSPTNAHTFTREWLDWVHTGYATAIIREALGQQSDYHKIRAGKKLLQESLGEHNKGFIEELDGEGVKLVLKNIGHTSLNDVYKSIADGHLDPEDVYQALFHPKSFDKDEKASLCTLKYKREMGDSELLHRIIRVYNKYRISFKSLHQQHKPEQSTEIITVKAFLTPSQRKSIATELKTAGVENLMIFTKSLPIKFLIGVVILFWSLNPVIAKTFLKTGITPISLLTIRLIAFCIFSSILYSLWSKNVFGVLQTIPKAIKLAILPAIGLIALPIFTYYALVTMPPSVHLTILRFNIVLIPIITILIQYKIKYKISFLALAISIACIYLLTLPFSQLPLIGITFSVMALITYSSYSLITEYILQHHKIGVRYPQLLFNIGIILGLFGLLMIPFQNWEWLNVHTLLLIITYTLFCVFIPHACFNAILKQMKFKYITDLFLLELPLVILFEILILEIILPVKLYTAIAVIIAIIVSLRYKTLNKKQKKYLKRSMCIL